MLNGFVGIYTPASGLATLFSCKSKLVVSCNIFPYQRLFILLGFYGFFLQNKTSSVSSFPCVLHVSSTSESTDFLPRMWLISVQHHVFSNQVHTFRILLYMILVLLWVSQRWSFHLRKLTLPCHSYGWWYCQRQLSFQPAKSIVISWKWEAFFCVPLP